jgi:hypothetical protein
MARKRMVHLAVDRRELLEERRLLVTLLARARAGVRALRIGLAAV